MKKEFRLLKSSDFKKVLEKKKRISCDTFNVYYTYNNLEHIRIGISVSKKVGNAVVRSTIRRKIRAIIDNIDCLLFKKDIVIIVKDTFLSASYRDNLKSFEKAFKIIKNCEDK